MTSLRYNHNLTLLYNDTKNKALINVGKQEPTTASSTLHRKLRAQKDRLVTWGLEWSEEASDSIDESVARVGLTENVSSILGNIKEVLEQADRISACPFSSDKAAADLDRHRDLLKDLTASIDALYDLSANRRLIARGTHPIFGGHPHDVSKHALHMAKPPFDAASFASSELTLVNQSFARPVHSPYAGLPASINPQALLLPAEAPPPYEDRGVPSTTRLMGRLSRSLAPESIRAIFNDSTEDYVSVLVEFSNYDSLYRDTGVPPRLSRVERLASALNQTAARGSLRLLGYVEDSQQPRIGLVYDYRTANSAQSEDAQPVTLLNLILRASMATRPVDISNATPFLEDRFRVALRVVEKLRDLHVENYFHGNLHSESIIFLQQGQTTQSRRTELRRSELHRPIISAFDVFARDRVERVNASASSNITRHPDDDGGELEDDVTAVRYDLYGLALILMEIGFWTPLNDFFKQKYTLKDFKLRLEKLYMPKLASKCGSLYLRAVQTCLRWSDNDDVGQVGVDTVYERIIFKLRRCCLLDEDEPLEVTQVPPDLFHDQTRVDAAKMTKKKRRNVSPSGHLSISALEDKASTASFSGFSDSTGPRSPILSMLNAKVQRSKSDSGSVGGIARTASAPVGIMQRRGSVEENSATGADINRHALQTGRDSLAFPFREYRRKVVLIQSRWRERRRQKAELRRSAVEESTVRSVQPDQHLAPPTNRCRPFPIKLPQSAIDQWHSDIGLRLSCIVERALKGCPESSSIDLVSLGHDAFSARPTIIVTCTNTARVKAALKRKFNYDKSMFDLKVRQGRVSLSKGKTRGFSEGDVMKRSHGRGCDTNESDHHPMNPFWQERPLCGASIGAYLPEHGHLEPVSFGGIVEIDDRQYGMSVHHMLDPPDDDSPESSTEHTEDEEDVSSGARRSSARNQAKGLPKYSSSQGYISDLSSVSSSDNEDGGYMSSDFESDVSDTEEQGDRPGILANSRFKVQITQPAFDDAVAEDLHADDATTEELDEDHLASYKLGRVYASSGLRRWNQDGRRFEIDWALLELEPPRLQPYNLIQGGRRHCKKPASFLPDLKSPICRRSSQFSAEEDWYPIDIVPADGLADLAVHCMGRTSGLQTGTIGAAMSFVKIRGRRNFSQSWAVVGDFGVGGDSGAWIIANTTGRVAGHVLAERDGLTYMCSMAVLFEDMQRTLGAKRISLPGPGPDPGTPEKQPIVTDEKSGIKAEIITLPSREKSSALLAKEKERFLDGPTTSGKNAKVKPGRRPQSVRN